MSADAVGRPSRWSITLLIFVMIAAAFALGIGVMRVIDASDDYGRFLAQWPRRRFTGRGPCCGSASR